MGKKIIIVPDSFKGSMTSAEVAGIIADAAHKAGFEALAIPLADGGEGSIDCILRIKGGEKIDITVQGPEGSPVKASYGITPDDTAVIEIAESTGITKQSSLHPMTANTFGFGEMIRDALDKNLRKFLLCLGGSASTDCGTGMAAALGVKFYDTSGECFIPCGERLKDIDRIDISGIDARIDNSSFQVINDVTNPLFGEKGAAYVFGPQKGADPGQVRVLDAGLKAAALKIALATGCAAEGVTGAGAAGGTGYACAAFLKARMRSGIDVMLDLCDFERLTKDCDLVVTGEGKLDEQSMMGKVLSGIRRRAGDKPIISFCGINGLKEPVPNHMKLRVVEIGKGIPLEESIRNGAGYLKAAAEDFFSRYREV